MRRRQVCLVAAGLVKSAGVLADTCHSSRSCRRLSFLTLQRGNALRDAPRYGFMPCRLFRRGRRGSRTAYLRGAWAHGVFRCLIPPVTARWSSCPHLSFLTLQRGNALRDALRHGFMPCRLFRRGRRASRTAYPRGAWARWCFPMPDSSRYCPLVSLRTPIVPHAPARERPS
ncbi:hypothetical protein B1F74_20600 [Pseudomonas syringae]|nr:hypothetical protein B1F74_20600 [Pseudomonas syringae]